MKVKEFKKKLDELTDNELSVMHKNSVEELFHLRFQLATAHLEDTSKIRQIKKNIARINTVLSERKQGTFWSKRGLKVPTAKTEAPAPVRKTAPKTQSARSKKAKGVVS